LSDDEPLLDEDETPDVEEPTLQDKIMQSIEDHPLMWLGGAAAAAYGIYSVTKESK